jgi:hypothetical protein
MFAELRRRLEGMVASLRAVKPERALGEDLCKTDLQRLTQDIMAASRPYLADAQAARFEGEDLLTEQGYPGTTHPTQTPGG